MADADYVELTRLGQLLETGNYAAARPIAERRLAREPDELATLVSMATIEWGTGSPEAALALARRAVTLHPDQPEGWTLLATAAQALGQTEDARAAAIRRVELDPADWVGHALVSEVFDETAGHRVRKEDVGVRAAQEAVRLAPSEPEAHVALGNAYLRRRDRAAADAEFSRALALDPLNDAALNGRAVQAIRRSPVQAAAQFADMSAQSPLDPVALHNLRVALGKAVSIFWIVVFIAANLSFRTVSVLDRHAFSPDVVGGARVVLVGAAIGVVLSATILAWRSAVSLRERRAAMLAFLLRTDKLLAAVLAILMLIIVLIVAAPLAPAPLWTPLLATNSVAWLAGVVIWLVRRRRMKRDRRAL